MAINLWALGGQPTSYNPIQTSATCSVPNIGDYVISFKAKSVSGAKIRVTNWFAVSTINQLFNLTSDFVQYSFSFNQPISQDIRLYDVDLKGDIIIQDIQLVEKPMGVATINGIDGFMSGKWIFNSNAKAIDDETMELNSPTLTGQDSSIIVNALPSATYTFSLEHTGRVYIDSFKNGVQTLRHVSNSSSSLFTFTTTSDANQIKIIFTNQVTGTFTFKRPILNLGSIPAPYEPKRGERMVVPVFNDDGTVQINAKPNKRQQLYSWMDNFEGKVSGSEVENPHVAKYVYSTILNAPTGAWFGEENYSPIKTLDSSPAIRTRLVNGEYAQQLFSFNLIELVKRKLGYDVPGTTTADKVQWLKDNVSKLTCSWYGFGNSVGGNKASLSVWNAVTISYTDTITHTSSSVTRLGLGIATPPTIANRIDVNGFIHFLAYAEPSDGVTASTINTDYVEVLVDTKPIVNLLDSGVLNAVNKVPKKNLFDGSAPKTSGFGTTEFINEILTVNGTWYTSFGIDVKPNTDYFLSGSAIGTITSTINIWSVDGGSGIIKNEALNTTFNTGAYNKIFIAFYSGNATSGVSTFNNIQLEEGPISTRYEHYTLVNKQSVQVREALR